MPNKGSASVIRDLLLLSSSCGNDARYLFLTCLKLMRSTVLILQEHIYRGRHLLLANISCGNCASTMLMSFERDTACLMSDRRGRFCLGSHRTP